MYASDSKKTITFQCPKHGEYITDVYVYPGLGEKAVDPACPECQKEFNEEQRRKNEEELQRKEELAKQQVIQKWNSMNIDKKYYESTFDNFDAYNDELRQYLEICRNFAEKPEGKLVMLGKNGNGKTHLAISVLKKLGGVIYTAFEIGVNLRQSYNGDTREHKVYEKLCTVPLLVIDEIEKIKDTESKQNWMSHVIGKRYNRMLPIILIANCHTQKDCTEQNKPCPYCLEYHLESDVISRIIEDGIIMKFSSDDYRRKIRKRIFNS